MSNAAANTKSLAKTTVPPPPGYKWVALSNTTLGTLMAGIDSTIVLIALPAIFVGLKVNPLAPDETTYLLWVLMGYMVITATLLVSFGRLSDIFGRVRFYNLGFVIFTFGSILLYSGPQYRQRGRHGGDHLPPDPGNRGWLPVCQQRGHPDRRLSSGRKRHGPGPEPGSLHRRFPDRTDPGRFSGHRSTGGWCFWSTCR